jgi:hypothetical protein
MHQKHQKTKQKKLPQKTKPKERQNTVYKFAIIIITVTATWV